MRLSILAPALSLAAVAAGPALAQDTGSGSFDPAAAVRGFLTNADLLGADTATVDSVTADGETLVATDMSMRWSTSFEVEGDTVTLSAVVTADRLEVDGLSRTDDGFGADRMDVPEVNLLLSVEGADEPLTYDLTMRDYSVTEASWRPFPEIAADPDRPVSRFAPLVDWSVNQSYALNEVGAVSGVVISGDDRQELSYGPIRIGPVENGSLRSFEYGEIVTTQETEVPNARGEVVPATVTIRYGPTRGTDVDAKPLAALLTGSGTGEGPQTVIGSTVLEGLSAEADDVFSLSFGENRLENVTVEPTGSGLMQRMDGFVLAFQRGEEPDPEDALALFADIYGAFAVGTYSFADIAVTTPDVEAAMDEVLLEGLSAAGMELFAVRGTRIDAPAGSGTLGALEIADFTFPEREALASAIMADAMGEDPPLAMVLQAVPTLGRLTVADLDVSAPMTGPISLDLFETLLEDFVAPFPTTVRMTLEGLEMPVALVPDPRTAMALNALGADPVEADASLMLDWDADTEAARLDTRVAVASAGAIEALAGVGGIPRDIFEAPQRIGEVAATGALLDLRATFEDEGLTQFLLGMIAEQSGLPPEQFVEGLVRQARMQVEMMTGDAGLAGQIADALQTFLGDPQSLTVAADPATPVPFAQVIGAAVTAPNRLPDLLNLSITANESPAR